MFANMRSLSLLLQSRVSMNLGKLAPGTYYEGMVLKGNRGFAQWCQTTKLTWAKTSACYKFPFPIPKANRPSFCTKVTSANTGSSHEDEYPTLSSYEAESDKKEVYIIQVKGLPWSCSAEDLCQFFSECRIHNGEEGIHFTLDHRGRSTGIAFIEMEHEEDVSQALQKHLQYIGSRYVEVYEVTNNNAEALIKKATRGPPNDAVVRIRGLPFSCTEADIISFFSGLDLGKNGVNIIRDNGGRNTGEALVQFSSQKTANEALKRHMNFIGNRYIEVFPGSVDHSVNKKTRSFSQSPPLTAQRNRVSGAPRSPTSVFHPSGVLPEHFIHMRGLPFHTNGEDIVKFFSPLALSRILIEFGPDGRPNGEADVYFTCHEDAVSAMSRDKFCIGDRYIELFLNSITNSH